MAATQRVRVELGSRSYDIIIGDGLIARAGEFWEPLRLGRRGVLIADENTHHRWAAPLRDALARAGYETTVLEIPTGEPSKTLARVQSLVERMTGLGLDRRSFVVAVGGGVVGDVAGFVAAIYLRGIAYVQVPTTLLAQVDSSVGGKVGVNLPQGKNLVGAFYQPRLVLIDTDALQTLPDRELRAGFAEVIKYGAIRDVAFFEWLERFGHRVLARDSWAVREAVARSCAIKAEVVGADETETTGLRAILNFGHTVGHALEAAVGYRGWLHGEAIAVGMCVETELSVRRAGLAADDARRIRELIAASGLPARWDASVTVADLRPAMQLDKKAEAGRLRFVLLRRLGEAVVSDAVTEQDLEEAVRVCGG